MSKTAAQFIYMTCRPEAEAAVKDEVARLEPDWRFSYSRPGFLTFKNSSAHPVNDRKLAERHWTFAHAHGLSLGKLQGDSLNNLAAEVWQHENVAAFARGDIGDIHVWEGAAASLDDEAHAAPVTPLCREIEKALRAAAPEHLTKLHLPHRDRRRATPRNAGVLDCIVLAPGEWWIGFHQAVRRHERWPGGAIPVRLPAHAVSRAYMKMEEAIQWSGLPLAGGDECVEIGCAPGGASQALLDRGLFVTGIDPAEVDPTVAEHPRFHHLKKRGKDVRRNEFQGVRWLAADMNIAPSDTLDEVEAIVTHPNIGIRGMVLTLKFSDWSLAATLPELIARVRAWGYREVRTRQLTTGGQEVCLVAIRRKALLRLGRRRGKKGQRPAQQKRRSDAPHTKLSGPHF